MAIGSLRGCTLLPARIATPSGDASISGSRLSSRASFSFSWMRRGAATGVGRRRAKKRSGRRAKLLSNKIPLSTSKSEVMTIRKTRALRKIWGGSLGFALHLERALQLHPFRLFFSFGGLGALLFADNQNLKRRNHDKEHNRSDQHPPHNNNGERALHLAADASRKRGRKQAYA